MCVIYLVAASLQALQHLLLLEHRRIGDARDRAARDANVLARDTLDLLLRQLGRVDPRLVERERALGDALVAVARGVDAGVASVE